MKGKIAIILLITMTVIFSSCIQKYSTKTVTIEKIDTSGIYFSYDYQDKIYNGHFDLEEIEGDFTSSDSLKLKIEKKQPDKFVFISVVKRIWKTENAIVSINKSDENSSIYSFHSVDQKPLFPGANNEYENDSLLFDFFRKHSTPSNDFKKIGVYILIDKSGKATYKEAMTKNNEEIQLAKTIVDKLPKFSTPFDNGDSVTVSYLVEIPVYN